MLWWWCCCWSKGQSAEDVVTDWKVKVLKMLLLIERSKCWRCCCWLKGQVVADQSSQSVDVTEDWRLKMKTTWCWKSFQWFIDALPWWCWWCPLSLSYYCCCRISFSLRGSVEIFQLRRIFYMYLLCSPMVLPGKPLVLLCTPMLLIGITNKSHVKVGH